MSVITFVCSVCKGRLRGESGKKVICPHCQQKLLVPSLVSKTVLGTLEIPAPPPAPVMLARLPVFLSPRRVYLALIVAGIVGLFCLVCFLGFLGRSLKDDFQPGPNSSPSARNPDEVEVLGLAIVKSSLGLEKDTVLGGAKITGTVVNRRNHRLGYVQISFSLYDSAGRVVGSAMANVNGLGPGESWRFEASSLGQNFSTFKISDLSGF